MGKQKRHLRLRAAAAAAASGGVLTAAEPRRVQPQAVSDSATTFGGTNFAAAGASPARGYITWSTLDPRRELPSGERLTLIRDSRALCANDGIAGGIIGIIAQLVGVQRPQLASEDEAWNATAEKALHFEWRSPLISDRRGIWSAYAVQPRLLELMLRDGEVFVILTKTDTGRAAFQIIEAHRCTGGPWLNGGAFDSLSMGSEAEWFDGIRLNRDGKAVAYWFADPDRTWSGMSGTGAAGGQIVPAANVIHIANRNGTGPHGVPALARAIINLKDRIETRAYTKAAMKIAAMMGLVITSDNENTMQRPMAGGLKYAPEPGADGTMPADAWSTADPTSSRPTMEQLFASTSGAAVVQSLEPGQEAKVLADDRPSPNMLEFHRQLLEDMATGLGFPADFIRQEKMTGPGQRYAIRRVQERINELREHIRTFFLDRYLAYSLAVADKNGFVSGTVHRDDVTGRRTTVRMPAEDWFAATWQTNADLTIDVGRDGNLELKQLAEGITTRSEIASSAGWNWDDVLRQKTREGRKLMLAARQMMQDFPELSLSAAMSLVGAQESSNSAEAPAPAPTAAEAMQHADEEQDRREAA